MPGWLWFALAIALGLVIYLLLRGRRVGGRHAAPAIEYIPPDGETIVADEAEDQVEPVLPTTLASQPDGAEQKETEAAEELAEDAELRHDEGYVETFGNVRESDYGRGTALPERGGAGPQGWSVKGNADSMLYYTDDAPSYLRAVADVWIQSEETATAAGFTRWDAHHR
jgi:hypothetical protein